VITLNVVKMLYYRICSKWRRSVCFV